MITYNKINDLYAEVLLNGVKIGNVEKHREVFTLEISYLRCDVKHSKRKMIGTLAKRIYTRLEEIKKPKPKLPISRLVTGKYEILD